MQIFRVSHILPLLIAALAVVQASTADPTLWDLFFAKHPERFDQLANQLFKSLNPDAQGRIALGGLEQSTQAAKKSELVPVDTQAPKYFSKLDLNGDGYVVRAELKTALRDRMQALTVSDLKARQKQFDSQSDSEYKPRKVIKKIVVRPSHRLDYTHAVL